MPEPAQAAPQKTSGSFASLLASLTSKLQNDPWDDSALPDDVAILTYEQALRTSRRQPSPQLATNSLREDGSQKGPAPKVSKPEQPQRPGEKRPRTASITIRVTSEEQAQLHERAAAAQLSVSAYLRSCILEAETLRTQVREALAQMQQPSASQVNSTALTEMASRNWRKRFFPAWSRDKTVQS
jgi:hypothetical protein